MEETFEIDKIIRNFLPEAKPEIVSWHQGEINRVVIFSDAGKEFALRIKKKPFPESSLIFEKDFLDSLNNFVLSVEVSKIFPTVSGDYFFEDDEHFYSLMSRVPGAQRFEKWYESHLFTLEDVKQGFSILGLLHNSCRQIEIEDRKKSPSVLELLDQFEKRFAQTDSMVGVFHEAVVRERGFLLEKIGQIRDELKLANYEKLSLFPVHYDINYTNVLWSGEKIVSLIDFDWAQFSTLEFDFAQMCKLTCGSFKISSGDNLLDEEKLRVALEAYNEKADVPLKDEKLLVTLLDCSSLFLAHWASDTFSQEKTKEKYYLSFFQAGLDRLRQEIKLLI